MRDARFIALAPALGPGRSESTVSRAVGVTALAVVVGMAACGGDPTSPVAPTEVTEGDETPPTVVSLELTGKVSLMSIGESAQLSLVARFPMARPERWILRWLTGSHPIPP